MSAPNMVPIADIVIGERFRKDMGDLQSLADSIKKLGLLQPIVLTPDKRLICGHRRLEAYKLLGRTEIPARSVAIESLLAGEFAENEFRKDFTPSERVAISQAVEAELGNRSGQRTDLEPVQNFAQVAGEKTRSIAAKAGGFANHETYRQAKAVVEQGAQELVEAMDAGEVSISAAAVVAKALPKEEQAKVVKEKKVAKVAKEVKAKKAAKPKAEPKTPEVSEIHGELPDESEAFDLAGELEATVAENRALQEQIKALTTGDTEAELVRQIQIRNGIEARLQQEIDRAYTLNKQLQSTGKLLEKLRKITGATSNSDLLVRVTALVG